MGDPTLGVYVHVPYCERVCPYCDFAVVAARRLAPERERRYVRGVLAELERRAPAFAGLALETLYLGGGTPSLLHPESVAAIVDGVRRVFPRGALRECTLEVNPSTLECARLPGFRAAGVDRVSLGVQSFDDAVLKRLGRAHRAAEARAAMEAVCDAGFPSLSADLIAGAPGQDDASLDRDLDALAACRIQHVSVYELTIEPGTPFALAERRGQLARPDEARALRMLEHVETRLREAGLARYEVSSYARPGREAQHNRRYWERRPVLGVGVGAWSLDPPGPGAPHGVRRGNLRAEGAWLARVEAGRAADAAEPDVLSPRAARGEAVFLALRTVAGLDTAGFTREFGAPPRAFFADAIDVLAAARLVCEAEDGRLRLTARGRALADTVAAHFL